MKGKVFIGWTLNDSLAVCVKNELKKYDFQGICGGREGSNEISSVIGATVIAQMKRCSSAIMLFSKRDEKIFDQNGNCVCMQTLSPNMLYELGYLSGSLNIKRVISVYLDGAEALVPTDIKGGWEMPVSTEGKSKEEIAKEIVEKFVAGQCDLIVGNKMELITDISKLRGIIKAHFDAPIYYENEIAFIILLLCQASYMNGEMSSDEELLGQLLQSGISDQSCLLAINSALDYFDACASIEKDEVENKMHLRPRDYRRLLNHFTSYVDEAEALPESQFKAMFLMINYEYLTFINMMYFGSLSRDEIDEEDIIFREETALKSIEYSEKFIEYDFEANAQVAYLYQSYALRNLAFFYNQIGKFDEAQEKFEESIDVRKKLYKYFQLKKFNQSITDQIKMEYHLALRDNLKEVPSDIRMKRIRELKDYIEEANEVAFNRKHLIDEIERVLNEVEADN